MKYPTYQETIRKAYLHHNRTDVWLAAALMIETAELGELFLKAEGI